MDLSYIGDTGIAASLALLLAVTEFWCAGRLPFVYCSRNFLCYIGLQGVVGALAFWGLDFLIGRKVLDLGQFASSSPCMKAIIVGISAQWLSNITILELGPG